MFQRIARNLGAARDADARASPRRAAKGYRLVRRREAKRSASASWRRLADATSEEHEDVRLNSTDGGRAESKDDAASSSDAPASERVAEAKHDGPTSWSAAKRDDGGSSENYKMPELDKWMWDNGAPQYAAAAIDMCARVKRHELEKYGIAELSIICRELGFDEHFCAKYAKIFEDNALDGWVFLEIVDWEDYGEIGVRKEHAVALCAVAKGVKGDFGYAILRGSASARLSSDRLRLLHRVRLTDAEDRALRDADRLADETGEGAVYGQLVVLGYKEYRVEGTTWHPVGQRNEKFELHRRKHANGIRRANAYVHTEDPDAIHSKHARQKRSVEASHSVTMSVASAKTADGKRTSAQCVTVEYVPDPREDMFQLGRMIVSQNDFVVRGPLHLDGGVLCGPVSRYACRLSCSRLPPYKCTLYAAGFNQDRDIFLSETAPKWQLPPGELAADDPRCYDQPGLDKPQDDAQLSHQQPSCTSEYDDEPVTTTARRRRSDSNDDPVSESCEQQQQHSSADVAQWDALTTFGVRIWKPEIGAWREVSVHGGVHEPREFGDVAGKRYLDEDSVLTNGTIVDLAGIQLLFESAESMHVHRRAALCVSPGAANQSDKKFDHISAPDRIVARFNARRPQCPVQLHTIRLEYDDEKRRAIAQDRRPFIFPNCGHVHAYAEELK